MASHTSLLQSLLVDEHFDGDIYPNEPMSRRTTFKIGGAARFFVQVGSIGALSRLIDACEQTQTPWVLMGRGSNVLVADEGFPGVIITLGRDFKISRLDEQRSCFCVGAGVSLSQVVQDAFSKSLAGLEFAVGIPGSVGGALKMNAGTPAQGVGQQALSVTTLIPHQGLRRYSTEELNWGYRTSSFTSDEIILECELTVKPADPFYIRGKMEASLAKRRKSQPFSQLTCGSMFKNPEGMHAAQLIDQLHLKGTQIGGAQISDVHANFIVNVDNARACDVCDLMNLIQTRVFEAYDIKLQPEVKFIGFA